MTRAYRRKVVAPPPEPVVVEETRRDRFYRIMEPRVRRTLHDIRLLSYGADRTRYDPSDQDIEILETSLYQAVDEVIGAYKSKIRGSPDFSFMRLPEDE